MHCVHLQCACCYGLCAPTLCVVLCTVCTYSVRGAMHCMHLQCAWCYALCAPTMCVVLCTVCNYSVRGATHCVHLRCAWCYTLCAPAVWYSGAVWTLPTISSPVNSQRKALLDKPVVSHLAKNFRTSHAIQKFNAVFSGARHISTSRASWIQSMPCHITSLISFWILSYHLRLLLPNRSLPQVSPHEPSMRISNRCRSPSSPTVMHDQIMDVLMSEICNR
jgi:hypothetical protein